ncbi:MAG: hypothetical protein E6G75_21820 [Alphaproteobacteria bacterium]|nr:MAG: hypothetical protein E6G75_21820 [Alphaproteobacteria bacterium]
MQKITELFAPLTDAITVSMETRLFFGSGEKNTRTVVFPILIGRDQAASRELGRVEDVNEVGLAGQPFGREVRRPHQHPSSFHVDQELVVHDVGLRTRLALEALRFQQFDRRTVGRIVAAVFVDYG